MRLLLDTHVILWLRYAPERVPQAIEAAIAEVDAAYVSVASAWEHGIKRLKRPGLFPDSFETLMNNVPFERLDLAYECHVHAESLPAIHADPFDRMLIAQALHHGLTIVTSDRAIARYPVETLW